MGRSQGVIFGYGAVIPTSEFVAEFPDTFDYHPDYKEWIPNEEVLDELVIPGGRVFYSAMDTTDEIFVATKSSADYRFEKGYIFHVSVEIDLMKINQERQIIEPWLRETFQGATINYLHYGYYTA